MFGLRLQRLRKTSSFERYLGSNERVAVATRQHPFVLFSSAGRMLNVVVPLLLIAWGVAGVEFLRGDVADWIIRGLFLIMLGLIMRLAWRVLSWEFERVVITNEKVIHVEGVLRRRIASTPIGKVSEFSVYQPFLGRIFDYGSLVVDVPGGRDQALHGLAFIPDPAGLYRLISDLAQPTKLSHSTKLSHAATDEQPTKLVIDPNSDYLEPAAAPILFDADQDHTIILPRINGN